MWSFLYATVIVGLVASIAAQNIKPVGELFQVDFTTNNQGGCNYVGQANMQQILQDAYDLGTIGSQLVSDYKNNVAEARRLLDSFFRVQNPPMDENELEDISGAYKQISDWILNGGPYDNERRDNTPFLFCYHNWLQKKTMSDPAQDADGEEYPNVESGGAIYLIRDNEDYRNMQQTETQDANLRTPASPYWSYKHHAYIFDRSYGGPNTGMCSRGNYAGGTQHVLNPSTITLCPFFFGTTNARSGGINYVARRSVAPNPILRANIGTAPANAQTLSDVTPTATTLFHELFHLVSGNELTTPPAPGEVYGLLQGEATNPNIIVGLDFDNASENPESFALAAVAYDYTLNWPPDNAGNRIEFEAGYTTQG